MLGYIEKIDAIRGRVKMVSNLGVRISKEKELLHILFNFTRYRLSLHNVLVVMQQAIEENKFEKLAKRMGYQWHTVLLDIFVVEFLSCAKSQLLFDDYSGNRSSKRVLFGSSADYNVGLIEAFLIENKSKISAQKILGKTSIKKLKQEAQHHFIWLGKSLKHLAKRANAIDDNNRFLINVDGVDSELQSNYMIGSEWMRFKKLNVDPVLPVSEDGWWEFIQFHYLPRAEQVRKGAAAAVVEEDDEFDVSLKEIKECHYLDWKW